MRRIKSYQQNQSFWSSLIQKVLKVSACLKRGFYGLGLQGFIFVLFCCFYIPADATCFQSICYCRVSVGSLNFGDYNPISTTATTATGSFIVTCGAYSRGSVYYTISLNAGNSGSFAARYMNLSGNHLNYNLYTTSAYTTVWGDSTGGTKAITDSLAWAVSPYSTSRTYSVYGRILAAQTAPVGTYTDRIMVSVVY